MMAEDLRRPRPDAVLLPGFAGTTAPDWVRRRVADGLGGVVLFARNCESPSQLAALTAALRGRAATVLVVPSTRRAATSPGWTPAAAPGPGDVALGVADDLELTRAVSARDGRRGWPPPASTLEPGPGRGREQRPATTR